MKDDSYFTIQPAPKFAPTPLAPNELFRGDYWSIFLENKAYVLGFVSGELAGRFKRISISEAEARQLMAGEVTCESVLIRHDAG